MNDKFVINCSLDKLRSDIRHTDDIIKKTILKKFLDIKMNQLRSANDDPSLDDLSENSISNESEEYIENTVNELKKDKKTSAAKKELDNIFKQQEESLNELDKLAKIKAYVSMIDENRKDIDQEELIKKRGRNEEIWQNKNLYDPKYIKYQKDDVMNNKLMERLNSEIDFRSDDTQKISIEKPFDDGDLNNTEDFARYEKSSKDNQNYSPNRGNKIGVGIKRSIRRN